MDLINYFCLLVFVIILRGDQKVISLIQKQCPGVVYGRDCYWATPGKHSIKQLEIECAKDGGNLTYFPNVVTMLNFEDYYKDVLLKYQPGPAYRLFVGLKFISIGQWKFMDGSDIPNDMWASSEPTNVLDQRCAYIRYDMSGFKLRDVGCESIIAGLCGKHFKVSKDRYSVEDGRLLNSNVQAFYSLTPSHCTQACFQTKWCKSCNYNKVNFQCELNSYTREDVQFVNFHNRSDYLYMTKMTEYN